MTLAELVSLAAMVAGNGDAAGAVRLYRDWLAREDTSSKYFAWFNLGVMLAEQGDHDGAANAYRAALADNPSFAQARINLGRWHEDAGQVDAAISEWLAALALLSTQPEAPAAYSVMTLNNLGRLWEQQHDYASAESVLSQSLAIDPAQPDVIQHWVHLRQKQCAWPVYAAIPGVSSHAMLMATSPLAMLGLHDDPALQLSAAQSFVLRKFSDLPVVSVHVPATTGDGAQRKLRLGYLGGNLCVHAVGLLLADVLEHQDRERFESHAFCYSPEDGTAYRQRLLACFDHVHRVNRLSDAQAAELITACGIDVLIDLHGLSDGVRPAILARRPAPVQVGWLGFIGTTTLPFIDHLIADRFALPESQRMYYSESPLYLSRSVLPLVPRTKPTQTVTRDAVGLPDKAFVFACLNNTYKINPEVFRCWMRILQAVPESVLWLVDDNAPATKHLRAAAAQHGVDSSRLIFAPRAPVNEYLARFTCADLFLDTWPYNAGSTACDALGMGLPLLTLPGKTFVSRMAGSLLHHAGLEELIATSADDYVARAIALGEGSERIQSVRRELAYALTSHEFADPCTYMREVETLLSRLTSLPLGRVA